MRLLHPKAIEVVALKMKDEDFNGSTVSRKQVVSHAWSEVLKFLATKQEHPKMFIDEAELGMYMNYIKRIGDLIGCKLNEKLLQKYPKTYSMFVTYNEMPLRTLILALSKDFFDEDYLISDAMSLYLKGCNTYPYLYGDKKWRKYCPIISLDEILRVVTKTVEKRKKGEIYV